MKITKYKKDSFNREQLEEAVDIILCGVRLNPELHEQDEIDLAHLILEAYVELNIPIEFSIGSYYKDKNIQEKY